MIESSADRALFFRTNDFAVEAAILGHTLDLILDSEFIESSGIASCVPIALCRAADFDSNYIDERIEIDGEFYFVREYQPDGTGMITIRLEKE